MLERDPSQWAPPVVKRSNTVKRSNKSFRDSGLSTEPLLNRVDLNRIFLSFLLPSLPAVSKLLGWKHLPDFFNVPLSPDQRKRHIQRRHGGDQEKPQLPPITSQAGSSWLSNPNPSCCMKLTTSHWIWKFPRQGKKKKVRRDVAVLNWSYLFIYISKSRIMISLFFLSSFPPQQSMFYEGLSSCESTKEKALEAILLSGLHTHIQDIRKKTRSSTIKGIYTWIRLPRVERSL